MKNYSKIKNVQYSNVVIEDESGLNTIRVTKQLRTLISGTNFSQGNNNAMSVKPRN
ncbi:MAG: hypothetical protein JWO06_3451 [Bacteroidota bacterium]|nr:hypothetical protein [Bacteroidota bacterium]